jgi:predicted HTH transcriptional regulator
MSAQLNDTHYAIIAAVHEQMPSHLFMSMSGDYNTHTLMWYTERAGGKEEHSLRFDSYAAQRAFISALEREGYFAQTSVTGLMFRRDSMRIPASVFATIYKPKQDDREIRQNAQIHANLAIAYELAAIVMEAHSSVSNALYYRKLANDEVSQIPLYLHDEYRQQLSHALYINGYLR